VCECHSHFVSNNDWLLTDFRFAVDGGEDGEDGIIASSNRRGTDTYRAPELLKLKQCSHKSDIWAIGCILFRVATMNKRCAFQSDWDTFVYYSNLDASIPKLIGEDNTELVAKFKDLPFYQHLNTLIAACLDRDPLNRPTALDLYNQFEALWDEVMGTEMTPSPVPSTDSDDSPLLV
jgi:serine/threonine protein kinase